MHMTDRNLERSGGCLLFGVTIAKIVASTPLVVTIFQESFCVPSRGLLPSNYQ